jgi:hypothetical protein
MTLGKHARSVAVLLVSGAALAGAGKLVWPAEAMTAAQYAADPEHSTLPFIERLRSVEEAVRPFGRI